MAYRSLLSAAVLLANLSGQAAFAQPSGVPAEFPPAAFTANQYVDSAGCAFIRAGIGGAVNWVPRVDRRRVQLCSFQPSIARPAPVVAMAPVASPVIAAPVRKAAPAPVVVAPVQVAAAPQSPRIVESPPVPAPVAAPLQKRADFCVGRSGLQPGFVSNRTGKTIDCGQVAPPATPQTAATAPATQGVGLLQPPTIPASNPIGRPARETVQPPAGYTRVWDDGRHNPNRGLPKATSMQLQSATGMRAVTSSRSAGPALGAGHSYVQVGTFADATNAQRLGQKFAAVGFPVGFAKRAQNGRALKVVVLGPFSTTNELSRALQSAQASGFTDAYTRN